MPGLEGKNRSAGRMMAKAPREAEFSLRPAKPRDYLFALALYLDSARALSFEDRAVGPASHRLEVPTGLQTGAGSGHLRRREDDRVDAGRRIGRAPALAPASSRPRPAKKRDRHAPHRGPASARGRARQAGDARCPPRQRREVALSPPWLPADRPGRRQDPDDLASAPAGERHGARVPDQARASAPSATARRPKAEDRSPGPLAAAGRTMPASRSASVPTVGVHPELHAAELHATELHAAELHPACARRRCRHAAPPQAEFARTAPPLYRTGSRSRPFRIPSNEDLATDGR